ncbi:MAG: hypothetical protein ACYC8T_33760 [Myxococcaceae bacterium]
MGPITADELLRFATTLEGEQLVTLSRGAAFSLRVLPDGIEFTPLSSGKPRRILREMVQSVCEEYRRSGSIKPGDYLSVTFDASYLLALIARHERR